MASLLNKIRDKAAEEISERSEEELRAEVKKGIESARKLLPEDKGSMEHKLGASAFDAIEAEEEELGKLGMWGLTAFAGALASGDDHAAAMIYLRTKAGWSELFAAIDSAQAEDAQAKRDRDAAKEAALKVVKKIGSAVGKAALPFLLGVL
jgi:hypothetical protein